MVVWLNDGSGQFTQFSLASSVDSDDMESGDLDGDGELDVFIVMGFSDEARIYFGVGDGSFESPQTIQLSTGQLQQHRLRRVGRPRRQRAPDLVLSGYSGFATWQSLPNDCNNNGVPDDEDIARGPARLQFQPHPG